MTGRGQTEVTAVGPDGHALGPPDERSGSTRALVALLAFVLGFATVPHRVCERDARQWFAGDPGRADALANGVARWVEGDLPAASFGTGSTRFDGEWLFATYVMAAMGFGQLALDRRDVEDLDVARMELCLDRMLDARVRAFDERAWQDHLPERGHIAYLGYAALPFALHRILRPVSRFTAREEELIAAITSRIEASTTGLVETYPGEIYPVDNTAAHAALALHAHAIGAPPSPALAKGLDAVRRIGTNPATGLLRQAVREDGAPRDKGRASGTALASYFLAFADPGLSRSLFRALEARQFRTVLGFGGMMEFPAGLRDSRSDIDSGPIVLGFGVSASGFAIGASRAHRDLETFTALSATAHLFGGPLDDDGVRTYVTGGPIGDAILFAMLTAPRAGRFT